MLPSAGFQIEAFLFNTKPHHCNTRVSVCLTCERPGFHPEMYCNNVTTGDYCFTKIVHNSSGIFTTKGSASSAFCDANKYQGSLAIPACRTGNIQEGTECVDCCKQYNCDPRDNYCNKHIIQDIHTPFTVTTPKTTPTVITTALPTTASTTTTPPSTSTPQRGGLCEVCVEGNGLSCGPARNHYCSKGENYCMNTVISDPRAGKIVVKKCADEVECKWNYWVDTLGDPKCSNVTGPQEDNACNYCCDNSDDRVPCNQDPIPKHLSTFDKPQEVKQCITGNSNSHFQLENCPPTSSYCLNEVRYDTTAKHPETLVIKRCALEAECKGLWWEKTRKRHECLTQNFTGITDQNIVCTFCCVSENGVCNGASVPDQIALFTPVATT
ncbi:uncharacterized protein LOC134280827, partial [Saccostrea cucullata]|uniref:uncharacterized protein LOC134280827 n=1 Tax=Saccostrea cuccullata TaxID=36930 RepID=UPI002ED1453C